MEERAICCYVLTVLKQKHDYQLMWFLITLSCFFTKHLVEQLRERRDKLRERLNHGPHEIVQEFLKMGRFDIFCTNLAHCSEYFFLHLHLLIALRSLLMLPIHCLLQLLNLCILLCSITLLSNNKFCLWTVLHKFRNSGSCLPKEFH